MLWAGKPKASTKAATSATSREAESLKKSTAQGAQKTGGETEATKRGRQAHTDWQPGEGYEKEVRLPSGRRADAVNAEKQDVKELKPNNPRAIKRGEKQVETYRRELEEKRGGQWTGQVETYETGEKK
ncbi:restriction endonuclease fold toxin 9 of polymorphic toxin system [Archangium gephyra]|uniref:Restriction endonuclease fold toxin 9 of polymorphic toxin system n=2 Tax=Archangium gephyra TaxID=48 RepID=A0ABX9JYN1_9BACT|nr:restriction endonuclease fold toxin 9 of polymorphic toxin system [Archangium gephyra]